MNLVKETLYLKIEQNNVVKKPEVTIKDVAKMECENGEVKAKVNQMRLFKFDTSPKAKNRQVQTFSVLKVIEMIHQEYPQIQVEVVGESDFIVHYLHKEESKAWQFIKTAIICVIAFFGASFMVVTFCKEVSMTLVLDFIYTQLTGRTPANATVIDISFCIGLPLGVLLFYNHIGRKRVTDDPTPVQVSMRKYEQDVDTTFIESSSREGKSIDVD